MPRRARLVVLTSFAVLAISIAATAKASSQPTFVTSTVDETQFLPFTSTACGFPVYEHDTGTVTTMLTTLPDGSTKAHDIAVHITVTFYSTDPAHPNALTTRGVGGLAEIDHPDGSVTIMFRGQNGHVTIAGAGIVWASSGLTRLEIDANGNVTEIEHGNFSPNRSGLCPGL
jgi:hypothetical protein